MIESRCFVIRKDDFQIGFKAPFNLKDRGKIETIQIPSPKSGEVLIRNYAAGLNFNSVWSLRGTPANPFQMIESHVRRNPEDQHHLQDFQVIGSDSSGVIVAIGDGVGGWSVGDEVVVHCHRYNENDPITEEDSLLSESQSIWGYETNYGAFSEYSLVRSHQLLRRPTNLTWEESASYDLTLSTAYRMLLSENGAQLRAGELCLVWGAAGGLGLFAIQLAKYVGANVIAVVSNELRAQECLKLGADAVVNRSEMKHKLLDVNGVPNLQSLREYKKSIEKIGLGLPDVVFEHVGRETLALSVFLARRGGRIVTCAATSGAESQIDLRYLWLGVKRIIGSHIATHEEAISANKLITAGSIKTTVSTTGTLEDVPQLLTDLADGVITGKAVVRI